MSHWIAVNWDRNQLLILTAKTKKGKAFYEKAVRIQPGQPRETDASRQSHSDDKKTVVAAAGFTAEAVKAKLRHFVQQERLGKYDTVVVMGRDEVEVRSMIFPPVPNDEIPDMAKFQASKEFTEYDHSASLDFVLFDGARKDKKHILAATLGKTKREMVEDVVSGAGLDLQRIVLGPCESAKRFATITVQQKTGGAGKTTLLVEMSELSATLVLLYRGQPAFVRTAHFQKSVWAELNQADKKQFENADELTKWKWLTAEFKRTIVAAINDVPSEKIDEIVLCGVGERYEKLMVLLEESIAVPVSLFNVWRFENREGEIKNHLPVFEEQFLPLIGALTAALAEKPNALDFKNPKRKPEKRTNRTLVTAIIAACVMLVFTAGAWGFYRRVTIEAELNEVVAREQRLKEETADFDRLKAQHDKINEWKDDDVNWLEQLEWLSNSIPRSQDVILAGSLSLSAPVNADPFLKFTAHARGTTVTPQMEENLRDETHKVISPKDSPSQNPTYTRVVDITVRMVPPKKLNAQQFPATNAAVKTDSPMTSDAAGQNVLEQQAVPLQEKDSETSEKTVETNKPAEIPGANNANKTDSVVEVAEPIESGSTDHSETEAATQSDTPVQEQASGNEGRP